MKSSLICLIVLASSISASAQYQMRHPNSFYLPEKWPQHSLRFSDPGMFVDVFDSGLKPYYFPGSEDSMLEVKHVRLSVTDAYGITYPELNCETIEIRPNQSGRIYDFQSISQPMTYEEARAVMTRWLPYINIAPAELEIFLENVRKKPTGYDDLNFGTHKKGFGGGWTGKNQERYFVWFRKAYSYETPLCLGFRVDWSYSMSRMEQRNWHRAPIPAPAGYEIQPRPKNFGPDDMYEMMHAKGIPFMKGFGLGGEGTVVIELADDGTPVTGFTGEDSADSQIVTAPARNFSKIQIRLSLIVLVVVTSTLVVVLWCLKRRKSKS